MATKEGGCFNDLKDDTFYEIWFDSQFPIKCVPQILMIEDVLKTGQAQKVLMHRFRNKMQSIYRGDKWANISDNKEMLRNLLFEHFTKDIVLQLYGNVLTDTYNILNFKSSGIMKCLKIAKDEVMSNSNNKITDQIIDKEIFKMWFDRSRK